MSHTDANIVVPARQTDANIVVPAQQTDAKVASDFLPSASPTEPLHTDLASLANAARTNDPGMEILQIALSGVNPKFRTNSLQLLRHLSFVNRTSKRFEFDPADFGIWLDNRKIPKSNLVELLNTIFRRPSPRVGEDFVEREKGKLKIPGMFEFIKLLGSVGIPSSMFTNPIVQEYIRRGRR